MSEDREAVDSRDLVMAVAEKTVEAIAPKLDKLFEDFCRIAAVGVVLEARRFFDENRADIATAIGAAVAEKWVLKKKGNDQ